MKINTQSIKTVPVVLQISVLALLMLNGCASLQSDESVERNVRATSSEELCYAHYMKRVGPRSQAVMDRVLIERGDDCTKYDMTKLMQKEQLRILQQLEFTNRALQMNQIMDGR